MTEFEKGDKVRRFGLVGEVLAVDGDWLWIRYDDGVRGTCTASAAVKVGPRFETGKKYAAAGHTEVTVTAVNDNGAIGWQGADALPWARAHSARCVWTPVE